MIYIKCIVVNKTTVNNVRELDYLVSHFNHEECRLTFQFSISDDGYDLLNLIKQKVLSLSKGSVFSFYGMLAQMSF